MLTDLFGFPIPEFSTTTSSLPAKAPPPKSEEARLKRRRSAWITKLENSRTLMLFDEMLDYLRAPLLTGTLPPQMMSDRAQVALLEETGLERDGRVDTEIPYEPWGSLWVASHHEANQQTASLNWSEEAIRYFQCKLFWESLEELSLHNNEHEKWSVLKWIFRPAIGKYYIFDQKLGRSHCLTVHERDDPFSYHNCCMAARMDEEAIRAGVCRHVPGDIIEAVKRVVRN